MARWLNHPMLSYDVETTGVDVENDRILTASLTYLRPGLPATEETLWINPGVPIPAGATAVHGITDAKIKSMGQDPQETLEAIALVVSAELADHETLLIGYNISFDLTILDRECRRHGVKPLTDRLGDIWPVLDPFILDKAVDPYRKGSRRLVDVCANYNVPLGADAHSSAADALATARLARRIGRMYPAVGELEPLTIHLHQMNLKADQDASFATYLRKQGKSADGLDGVWPVRLPTLEEVPSW